MRYNNNNEINAVAFGEEKVTVVFLRSARERFFFV